MLVNNNLCTGCTACKSICPRQAIDMIADKEGFLQPLIDKSKCVDCKLCERVCPINKKIECKYEKTIAAVSKNDLIRMKSSSGGIFYEIAKKFIENDGYVCGAAFDNANMVHHIIINDMNEIDKLLRSKYVQSRLDNVFVEIRKLLLDGKKVLFVGTGCQVNGLVSFLQEKYTNLYTIDIICHGVPSPLIWEMYLNKTMNKLGNDLEVNSINFRDKKDGWEQYGFSFNLSNGIKIYENHYDNLFSKVFLSDISLRLSCYNCTAKGNRRFSDLTIGDFWGCSEFDVSIKNDKKGLSLIIIHSPIGEDLITNCDVNYEKVDNEALNYNYSYSFSVKKPKMREKFFSSINEENFDKICLKYIRKKPSIMRIYLGKVKRFIKKLLK